MLVSLMLQGLRHGKTRFLCAVAGVAIAAGTVFFTASLTVTQTRQATTLAARAAAPWAAWRLDGVDLPRRGERPDAKPTASPPPAPPARTIPVIPLTLDYRPGGHVLQGPPMRALLAPAPAANPYARQAPLTEGRWPAAGASCEVVMLRRALQRGREPPPPLGTALKFVGRAGTMTATLVGYLEGARLPPQFPTVFANDAAWQALSTEKPGRLLLWESVPAGAAAADLLTPTSDAVAQSFQNDEQRRMNYARPLLLVAALLTALSLLVNTLLLSIESNRPMLARLRMAGLTRMGTVRFVLYEGLFTAGTGIILGLGLAMGALAFYVAADPVAFPVGVFFDWTRLGLIVLLALVIVVLAIGFVIWPACRVRPLEAQEATPRRRHIGMAITFACGFAAFVAVEVWGASLMRGFVPSPEWPDAIVSLLPGGVSAFDVEKLRKIEGVKRIGELMPLQLPLATPAARERPGAPRRGVPNALFLAAEWLPRFRFLEGTWEQAHEAMRSTDACVITEMMSRAQKLHAGDRLTVRLGRGPAATETSLPIAGVVDLNWHMVTSRGLVRGLNGASPMTDGPVFCSLDTLESLDARPSPLVTMTHLWVEYEPDFLKREGVFPAGRRIEETIARALGHPARVTVRLHARDEIADGTLAHGSDLIGQAARVPFVFLFVLALGFVAMLVAEAEAQRHVYRILRAVGATRGQLVRRLAQVALKTAGWGILAGVPAGALIGWLFARGTGAVWPGMPHYFVLPVRIVIEGAVGALLAAFVFAVPTALMLVLAHTRRTTRG